jgi:hypothetical protein
MKLLLFGLSLAWWLLLAPPAHAEPVRILVAVGSRPGAHGEPKLRHSVRDARRVRDVLVSLGGVRREHAILLEDPSAAALRGAFSRAQALARKHRKQDVSFFFYYSGHGNRDRIHLGTETVSVSEISARIDGVPAALRIVVSDACRTASVREKGASAETAFEIRLRAAPQALGTAWIHATAAGEAAQESDALGGAVFTHYFVSGLRGAADRDGDRRVTLAEAYAFAYHSTLIRSARSSGVLQRPSAELELEEHAPIVLTQTRRASALLALPRGADTQYLVYATGARAVVAEIWSRSDSSVELALPPGRYLVHRRGRGRSAVAEVSFANNQQRALSAADFRAVEDEAMTEKGGRIVLHPNALSASYGLRAGGLIGIGHGGRLLFAHRLDGWALGAGAEAGIGEQRDGVNDVTFAWLGGELRLERRFELAAFDLRAGARVTGGYGWQKLERVDDERLAPLGYSTEQRFGGSLLGAGAVARALFPIDRAFLELGGTADLLAARRGEQTTSFVALGVEAGAGFSLIRPLAVPLDTVRRFAFVSAGWQALTPQVFAQRFEPRCLGLFAAAASKRTHLATVQVACADRIRGHPSVSKPQPQAYAICRRLARRADATRCARLALDQVFLLGLAVRFTFGAPERDGARWQIRGHGNASCL